MQIKIDSIITIKNPPQELIQWCNSNLIFPNPAYAKLIRMGKRVYGIPKNFVYYKWHNEELILPRGLLKTLWNQYPKLSLYRHNMRKCQSVRYRSDIQLRDYQYPAIQAVKSNKQGIIVMPCGAGKTETALQIIAELQQPALWITHTRDLLNQSLGRAKNKLHLQKGEYGIIGGGEFTIGTHITFATIQSLKQKDVIKLSQHFGAVIIDECHRAFMTDNKASMFQYVLERLDALYRIGVTASEHRSDGLIKSMYNLIGDKIYEVSQERLNNTGNVVKPEIIAIHTHYKYAGNGEFSTVLHDLATNIPRNQIIRTEINQNQDNYCLVLSDRLEQLEWLRWATSDRFAHSEYINGKTNQKERKQAIQRLKNGDSNILFATYSLAKEGLDIPRLERLFLCTPHRDKVAIQQSVGRIMRPFPGKAQPIVYDFVDQEGICVSQYKSRKAIYKKLGCQIKKEY